MEGGLNMASFFQTTETGWMNFDNVTNLEITDNHLSVTFTNGLQRELLKDAEHPNNRITEERLRAIRQWLHEQNSKE